MTEGDGWGGGWLAAGIISLLTLAGGSITWLVGRKDRSEDTRTAKLDAWHKELMAREQLFAAQQAAFQTRIDSHLARQDEKIGDLERDVAAYRASTASLVARVTHYDPDDPVLDQVAKLLGAAFPLTPGDFDETMTEQLRRLD